jgi:hypothetical protein
MSCLTYANRFRFVFRWGMTGDWLQSFCFCRNCWGQLLPTIRNIELTCRKLISQLISIHREHLFKGDSTMYNLFQKYCENKNDWGKIRLRILNVSSTLLIRSPTLLIRTTAFLRKMKTTPSEKYEIRGKNWDLNDFQSRVWKPGPIWSAPVREKPFAKIMTGQQVLTIPGRLASFVLVKHRLIQKISGLVFQALG